MTLLYSTIVELLNSLKSNKTHALILYTKTIYLIILSLKKYFIDHIYILENVLLIYFKKNKDNKNIHIRIFNLKNKQNFYSYTQLNNLKKKNKDGIIFTSKGIYSLNKVLNLKQGGILFCLIYYSN